MLDHFLKVAYAKEVQQEEDARLSALLQKLPVEDLQKIASGEMLCSNEGGSVRGFIGQFEGSPLLPQAMQLEQEELQAEMLRVERGLEDEARQREMEAGGSSWRRMDEIRIRKRLLELELAKERLGSGAPAPAAEAPAPAAPAGPPMEVAPKTAASKNDHPGSGYTPAEIGMLEGNHFGAGVGTLLGGGAAAALLARNPKSRLQHIALGAGLGGALGHLAGGLGGSVVGMGLRKGQQMLRDRDKTASLADAWGRELAQREAKTAGVADHLRANAGTLAGMGLGGLAGVAAGSGKDEKGERSGLHMGLGGLAGAAAGGALGRRIDVSRDNTHLADNLLAHLKGRAVPDKPSPYSPSLKDAVGAFADAGGGKIVGGLAGVTPAAGIAYGVSQRKPAKNNPKSKAVPYGLAAGLGTTMGMGGALSGDVLDTALRSWAQKRASAEAKTAGIGGMLGGLAKANPGALVGAGLGAAGGLANGLQKDQNGQRHIMSGLAQGAMGAAAGGLAGHAAQNIGSAVQGGATLGAAAKGYGTNMLGKAQAQIPGIVDKAKGVVGSAQGKLQGMFGKAPGTGTLVSAT